MYAEDRQQEILRLARDEGRADVTALHGGAVPVGRLGFEPALATRDAALIAEKERIAKAALAELPEEGAVILDAGTTTRLARTLPTDRELTVLVNSPVLATMLSTQQSDRADARRQTTRQDPGVSRYQRDPAPNHVIPAAGHPPIGHIHPRIFIGRNPS